jgi:hypothetical protein
MLHVFADGSVDTLDVRLRTLQEQREAAGAVGDMGDDNDEDEVEIIEVEEPFEPVPMQDSCLQVFYNLMTNFGTRKNDCKMFVCLDFFSRNCYLVVQDTVLVHEVQIMDLLSLSNEGILNYVTLLSNDYLWATTHLPSAIEFLETQLKTFFQTGDFRRFFVDLKWL